MSESGSDGEKALDEAIEILEGLGHAGIRVRGEQAERLRRAVDRITSQDYGIQESSNRRRLVARF